MTPEKWQAVKARWQAIKVNIDGLRDKAIKWINWALALVAAVDWGTAATSFTAVQQYIPQNLATKALMAMAVINWLSHNFLKHRPQ